MMELGSDERHYRPDKERGGKTPEEDNSPRKGLVGGWGKVERTRSGRAVPCRSLVAGLRSGSVRADAQAVVLVVVLLLHPQSSEMWVNAGWG